MVDIKNSNSLEQLRQLALLQDVELRKLNSKVQVLLKKNLILEGKSPAQLQMELTRLQEQIQVAQNKIYGASSERTTEEQHLFDDALPNPMNESEVSAADKKDDDESDKKKRGHGPTEQLQLEVKEESHKLDDADKTCPCCGGDLNEWHGHCEESEEIDVVKRQYIIIKHQRQKYKCACGHIDTALGSTKLVPGGRYSTAFAVHVAIQKYADHLPLYRQVGIMKRSGLVVTSQTLWDQIYALAKTLEAIMPRLLAYVLSHAVVHADETTWRLLKKSGKKTNKSWYLWAVLARDAVVFNIENSRSADAASVLLNNYDGTVMADGYTSYIKLQKDLREQGQEGFMLAGCWAHARRKFVDAEPNYTRAARAAMALINELYYIEREITEHQRGPPDSVENIKERLRIRKERSAPIVDALTYWSDKGRYHELPTSSLGKAFEYLRKQAMALRVFLNDGRVPLDNNPVERVLRGPVIGRKNHYGSGSERATKTAAILYSLIESAKLNHVDPDAYLRSAVAATINGDEPPLPHEYALLQKTTA